MRSTAPLLFLGAVALAAGIGLAPACAKEGGHGLGGDPGSDASPGSVGDGGTSPTMDAGCVVTAVAAGVGAFSATCATGAPPTVDWSYTRRVSRIEYNNMVRDLLGDTTQPATALNFEPESPMTQSGVNLTTNTYQPASEQSVVQYLTSAETLAQTAASNLTQVYSLNGIAACATQDDTCAQAFISAFALRAFRGHLDTTESAQLFALYQNIADAPNNLGFATGIRAVITSVLSSPWFLYVVELGDGTATAPGAAVPLSQYEIAARLAFYLWRSVPDVGTGSLMAAAAAGTLSTPAQIEAQAQRMLTVTEPSATGTGTSLKALDAINDFATQWLEILAAPSGKDPVFKPWSADSLIGQEMKDETLTNFSQILLAENGGLTELLTSTSSYVNSNLATFYSSGTDGGVPLGSGTSVTVPDPTITDTTFVKTALPQRAGILTNGSILAIQSHALLPSSVLRGKMIREDILCDAIDPPPAGVTIPPAPLSVPDGGTTRSLLQAHAQTDGTTGAVFCYGCHKYMDFIAFGMGHYDATGAYQAFDQNGAATGPTLDVTGNIFPDGTNELSAAINGATDPVNGVPAQIANSTQGKQCFALQEFRYSLGRVESATDACSLQQIYSAFTGSSLNLQKLMIAIVGSDAFRYRSANDLTASTCVTGAADAGSPCP
jgi:hypothetical protein